MATFPFYAGGPEPTGPAGRYPNPPYDPTRAGFDPQPSVLSLLLIEGPDFVLLEDDDRLLLDAGGDLVGVVQYRPGGVNYGG